MQFNELATAHYQWIEAMGWHNKTQLETLALIASEIGEAFAECASPAPSDAFGEELADIALRRPTLDEVFLALTDPDTEQSEDNGGEDAS